MPTLKRPDIPKLLQAIQQGEINQIYLIFGERFLCRETADELINRLLSDEALRKDRVQNIDGDQEDASRTLGLLRTYSLFPGRRITRVTDTRLFFSKGVAKTFWEKADKAMTDKEPTKAGRYLLKMLELGGLSPVDLAEDEIATLSASRWKTLFGFARPTGDLEWTKDVLKGIKGAGDSPGKKTAGGDASDLFIAAYEIGVPADNILILTAEAVDKRKKIYKFFEKKGAIIDLSIDTGGSAAARKDQDEVLKELIKKTLAEFNKKLDPKALPLLLERVGFHPVAVVLETEKLALYTGDAPTITRDDVDAVIGRTREEALYELTEAVTAKKLDSAMLILARLQENGIHALAILATLRNHFKKLLLIRSFQEYETPAYTPGMPYPAFQKDYLPKIKSEQENWDSIWKGHPYALYMMFRQAEKYDRPWLRDGLKELLAAEYRLKGSAVSGQIILENLVFNILRGPQTKNAATR